MISKFATEVRGNRLGAAVANTIMQMRKEAAGEQMSPPIKHSEVVANELKPGNKVSDPAEAAKLAAAERAPIVSSAAGSGLQHPAVKFIMSRLSAGAAEPKATPAAVHEQALKPESKIDAKAAAAGADSSTVKPHAAK